MLERIQAEKWVSETMHGIEMWREPITFAPFLICQFWEKDVEGFAPNLSASFGREAPLNTLNTSIKNFLRNTSLAPSPNFRKTADEIDAVSSYNKNTFETFRGSPYIGHNFGWCGRRPHHPKPLHEYHYPFRLM